MKTSKNISKGAVLLCLLWVFLLAVHPLPAAAAEELIIDYAFSENAGFINASHGIDHDGPPNDTAEALLVVPVIPDPGFEGYLEGFLWGENIGWVKLGLGDTPYSNPPRTDSWGVNITDTVPPGPGSPGRRFLSGRAWSETSGWIVFDLPVDTSYDVYRPILDLDNGDLSGTVWSENLGWIRLRGGVYSGNDLFGLGTPPAIVAAGGGGVSEGDCQVTFRIELNKPPMRTTQVDIDYTTTDGTASGGTDCTGGADYITESGSSPVDPATISGPAEDQYDVVVDLCNDRQEESDETFSFDLSNAKLIYGTIEIALDIDLDTVGANLQDDDYPLDVSVIGGGSVTSTGRPDPMVYCGPSGA